MKQRFKELTHNLIVHPLMCFLPERVGTQLHDRNAKWCWPKG